MNPALLFLLRKTLVTGLRERLRRLKQLRYLLPTLVGAAYFLLVFGFHDAGGSVAAVGGIRDRTGSLLFEWGIAAVLLLLMAGAWLLPAKGPPLQFLEAEVALLFPAPLTRGDLVRFKLLDMQKYLLPLPLFFGLIYGLRDGPGAVARIVLGGAALLNLMSLHQIGARFTRQSLLDHGRSGWSRQGPVVGVLAAVLALSIWGAPPLPAFEDKARFAEDALHWLEEFGESPGGWALHPFRLPARMFLAPDLPTFLLQLLPVAALVLLLYAWVIRTDAAFEEAAAAHAATLSRRIEAARKGKFTTADPEDRTARPAPWRLAPVGPPEGAFVWKSLCEVVRFVSPRLILFFVVALAVMLPIAMDVGRDASSGWRGMGAGLLLLAAGMLVFAGPSFLGSSLRADLEMVEFLKTLPVTSARLMRASLAGTVLPTAAIQAGLVVAAALLAPDLKEVRLTPGWRVGGAAALLLVLPSMAAVSTLVDMGAVLWFPAWVRPGQAQIRGGMEGMGYGIVTMLGKVLALGLGGGIPVLVCVLVVALAGSVDMQLYGPAALVLGGVLAAGLVHLEVWIATEILGRRFEALDPAAEGILS